MIKFAYQLLLLIGVFTLSSLQSRTKTLKDLDSLIVNIGIYEDHYSPPSYEDHLDSLYFFFEIARELNYTKGKMYVISEIGILESEIGILEFMNGYYDKAQDNLSKALLISEHLHDSSSIGSYYNYLALLQRTYRNNNKAETHFRNRLRYLNPKIDHSEIGSFYAGLGQIYLDQNELDTALQMAIKSHEFYQKSEHEFALFNPLFDLGLTYLKLGKHELAIEKLDEALNIAERHNFLDMTVYINSKIGIYYYEFGDHFIADYYFKESLKLSKDTEGNVYIESSNYEYLSKIESAKGNCKKAFS